MLSRRHILTILVFLVAIPTWGDDDTLRVVSVHPPPPFSLGSTPPETIVVEFNQPVLESSLDDYWTIWGMGYNPTLTTPTQLTLDVSPGTPASSYYLTLRANIDDINDYSAQRLALELGNQLTAPPDLVDEIHTDVAAIRREMVEMTRIQPLLPWAPGRIWLDLNEHGLAMYLSGTFYELYALNEIYGPVEMQFFSSIDALYLEFDALYHSPILAPIYLIEGVTSTSPAGTVGDGPDIEAEPPFYTFIYAWGDCPAGCTEHHWWDFEVVDDTAVLLAEGGDPLDDSFGPTIVAGVDGKALDGEYTGSFPSGDGIDGGTFTIRWGWCDLFLEGKDPTLLHYVDSFQVATGSLSELRSSGTFDDATCLGNFPEGPVVVTLPDPPAGDAIYFVARGSGECSAVGFGQSSLPHNPREKLEGVCFSF